MDQMTPLAEAVLTFFQEDDWPFTTLEGTSALAIVYAGQNGQWTCYAQTREEQRQFVFYSVLPVNVPEDKRGEMAEFLTRANYGLIIGNFEMDFSDGEIRYKTSLDVEGDRLVPALVKQAVYANVFTMDTYLPGILSVLYGDVSAREAILRVEDQGGPGVTGNGAPGVG